MGIQWLERVLGGEQGSTRQLDPRDLKIDALPLKEVRGSGRGTRLEVNRGQTPRRPKLSVAYRHIRDILDIEDTLPQQFSCQTIIDVGADGIIGKVREVPYYGRSAYRTIGK